jgi:hypothetical protein
MGLTKRKDSWYVEFPVIDDGKALQLARGYPLSQAQMLESRSDKQRCSQKT